MDKAERQSLLRDVLSRNELHSQTQVQALMEAEGVIVSQSTISRDLEELGLVKTEAGYRTPPTDARAFAERPDLSDLLSAAVRDVRTAGHLVVLRTAPGAAGGLARALERAPLSQVVGMVADEATVFVACATASRSTALARELRRMAGLRR